MRQLFAGLEDGVSTSLGIAKARINGRRCEEKLRLLVEYRKTANVHSAYIALMAEIASGLVQKEEFALLSRAVRLTYEKCIDAHDYFYKHMEEHGC